MSATTTIPTVMRRVSSMRSLLSRIRPAPPFRMSSAIEAFRAEVAEIIFFSPDGSDALRTTVRAAGPAAVLESLAPDIADELRQRIEAPGPRRLRHLRDRRRTARRLPADPRARRRDVRRAQGRAQLDRGDDDRQPVRRRGQLLRRRR